MGDDRDKKPGVAGDPDTTETRDTDPPDLSTISIPGYCVLRKLGEGGMGEVYEAEQLEPVRRRVALKLLKAGMDTKQVLARFEAERQALALMNHAYIAQVYDAGATDRGRSYFAMEFVRGLPITDYCDRQHLSIRERLDLFVRVCEGVQHAHQKGIIHRDLKPSNVLVAVENDEAKPKIIDFGVARATDRRLTEQTLVTQLGAIVGTPEYMSPEQAELTPLDIDTRSDVYSLGVLLHVLLVGALPFDSRGLREGGVDEMRRRIREEEPRSPSTRVSGTEARELRGDLDWIVMRALEKDRTRRYASAVEFAADIRRHLNDEPVVAGPPGAAYRLGKFVRRHRTGVVTGSLMLLALVVGAVAATYGMVRAVRAEAAAREEAATASEVSDFLVGLFQISDPGTSRGNTITAREILDRGAERVRLDLADQPLVQSRMLAAVGAVYRGLGLYSEAEDLLRRALAIREQHLDPEDPVILDNLFDLGWTLALDGRPGEVLELTERLLPAAERVFAADDPRLARVLAGVAHIRFEQGMRVEAETLTRRALAIWEDRLDTPFPFRAHAMDLLGTILAARGETEEGLALLEAAETYRRDILGPDHPDMARSAFTRARIGSPYQGSESLADLEAALRIREETLGPDHPELVEILEQLAYFFDREGDREKAREYYERSIRIATEANPHHEILIDLLVNYAIFRSREGEVETVVDLYERALEITERNGGTDHPEYPSIAYNLGDFLFGIGNPAEAAVYFEKSLAVREKHLPSDHEQLGWTLHGLAQSWRVGDRADEAEPLYRRALRIIEGVHGSGHELTALVVENLAASLNQQGKLDEARPYWERARKSVEQALGADHLRMIGPLYGTANLHYRGGDHAAAIPFHKRALELQEASLGRDHRLVMTSYYNLGCLHALAGMREEAITYLNESLDRGLDWAGVVEDEDLASLRGERQFEAFLAEVRRRNGQ